MIAVFVSFLVLFTLVLLSVGIGMKYLESRRKRQVAGMLQTVTGTPTVEPTVLLVESTNQASISLEKLLDRMNLTKPLMAQLQQSGLEWTLPQLAIATVVAAIVGIFVGTRLPNFVHWSIKTPLCMLVFAVLPYLIVLKKRSRRLNEFEEQFPDALDFMARSMRAGHAFSISLEMLSEESPEPLGLEFRTLFNELNLGAPLDGALANLSERVPLIDVRFFASSVMLQKQTGGNLSEILVRLSYVIRERFRLKGQVKAASAHGRMTAVILTVMPIATMLGLLVVAPGYLQGMANDSDGRYLIAAAVTAQLLGYYFINRIIKIKV